MPGWNTTDFNWETLSTFYNAPAGLLLDDLLSAAEERYNVFNNTELNKDFAKANGPPDTPAYRSVFNSLFVIQPPFGIPWFGFSRPLPGPSYDFTNVDILPTWEYDDMVAELGDEPDYGYNVPVTAEWCQWWYYAINKLTRFRYRNLLNARTYSEKSDFSGSDVSYSAAAAAWESLPWVPTATALVRQRTFGSFSAGFWLERRRVITDQISGQWTPFLYAGNYTLSAWGKFNSTSPSDNVDYPCDSGTHAKVWDDASAQSGVYNKDIEVGNFETITVPEPPAIGGVRGWSENENLAQHARFDIAGGFKYVAP